MLRIADDIAVIADSEEDLLKILSKMDTVLKKEYEH